MTLEDILRKFFGCKKPFLKRKKLCGHWFNGEPDYTFFTNAGGKAYGKLTELIYELGPLLGEGFDAGKWIKELDRIASGEEY